MNILITGSSGMLGIALCDVSSKGDHRVTGLDLSELHPNIAKVHSFVNCDITDYTKLAGIVRDVNPEIIIHAAAFTDVDGCESDSDKAETVNGLGTRYIAEAANEFNTGLIYISTDFVFDGQKMSPYTEDDIPNPVNVYGRSKLDGEKFIADVLKNKRFFIVRSSWMFGMGGKNFVDTILKKAQVQKEIKVVTDQFGSPTYTVDLARAIARMLDLYEKKEDIYGIYHIANSDSCSWYRLAQRTLELANIYGVDLVPIVSEELDRPAERPMRSILDNSRYIKAFGMPLRPWDKALEEHIMLKGQRGLYV